MHAYRAFGLNIHSELEFPELPLGDGAADLEIRFGDVPDSLPNPTASGPRFEATANQLILKIDDHARYFASKGREIVVAREPSSDAATVRLFLLGSVIGAILHQRGLLPLHASAVEIDGRGVLFMGSSAVGKSTIAAALSKRGHCALSDEIATITLRDGQPLLVPSFPQLNIWADVAEKLGYQPGKLRRLRPALEKYGLPLERRYCEAPLPIAKAYILSTTNTRELKIDPLSGVAKLAAVLGQTYRPRFLGQQSNCNARHFELCAAVAQKVRVHRLIRPEVPFLLAEMSDLVERELSL